MNTPSKLSQCRIYSRRILALAGTPFDCRGGTAGVSSPQL
jgi:hypothetical protein